MTREICAIAAFAIGCQRAREPAADPPRPDADLALPAPITDGGPALFEVLAHRRSSRAFDGRALDDAELGQLLWAGQGITGPGGVRTAPSAGALYPLTLYVADHRGLWRYDPHAHALAHLAGDARAAIADAVGQAPAQGAPVLIVIVATPSITAAKYGDRAPRYVALEAGHVAQDVLLAATALGLGAVPIGAFDDDRLRHALDVPADPLYVIAIGRPASP